MIEALDALVTRPGMERAADQLVIWSPQRWHTHGSPHSLPWSAVVVVALSTRQTDRLLGLPRSAVRDIVERTPGDFQEQDALLASCIWGFGRHPRAPARVQNMLAGRDSAQVLRGVIEASRTDGGRAGFLALFKDWQPRVPGLNVSFGTKLVYFAAPRTLTPRPLVYDKFVALGLQHVTAESFPLPSRRVPVDDYVRYLEYSQESADRLDVQPDDVEIALFIQGKAMSEA